MNVQFECSFVLFSATFSEFLNPVLTNCVPVPAFVLFKQRIPLHFPVYGSYTSSGSQDHDCWTYRVVCNFVSMISILDSDEEVKSKRMLKGGSIMLGITPDRKLKCIGLIPLHNAHCTFRNSINLSFFQPQTGNAYPRHWDWQFISFVSWLTVEQSWKRGMHPFRYWSHDSMMITSHLASTMRIRSSKVNPVVLNHLQQIARSFQYLVFTAPLHLAQKMFLYVIRPSLSKTGRLFKKSLWSSFWHLSCTIGSDQFLGHVVHTA